MKRFEEDIRKAVRIGITGHVRPDGDCTGSCLALYNYLQENYNKDNKKTIDLHLEPIAEPFRFLTSSECIQSGYQEEAPYDLFFALDCGSLDRLGAAQDYASKARKTINIDHHISNTGFASVTLVVADSSSTCEVLFDLFEEDKISKATAEALYLGVVHDTGVFKHSNTTEKTMSIAGKLITLGATPSQIIDETFYQKTYLQNQILGRCLMESILLLEGKIIVSSISKRAQSFYHVVASDLDGVIDQLRITKGVEVAIFLREDEVQEYKVSMRSNGIVDVSKIAVFFGGGGHKMAAGCSMKGSLHDVINNLTIGIEHQLKTAGVL